MASRLSVEPAKLLDTLKSTVFKNATNEELLALVVVSNEYQLNPLLKEMYAFPAKGGGIVPIVSVDGWNKMLIRHPDFDGIEFSFSETPEGELVSCTATVYLKNRSHPVVITEYFSECKRNTEPWNNMPRRMLRNRTLCQAARMACGFAGIYDEDEAASIVTVDAAIATATPSAPKNAPKEIHNKDTAAESDAGLAPAGASHEEATPGTPTGSQAELADVIIKAGFTFDDFKKWADQNCVPADFVSDETNDFSEVKQGLAKRLMRATGGLLGQLRKMKNPAV